jgi:thiaminase
MTHLKDTVDSEIRKLKEMTDRFPIEDKKAYALWLAQTYYFVCHSTRLLALASSRIPRSKNELHYRFVEHVKEERGHENLAIQDLKKLGESIQSLPELAQTQAFYQSQYYWIEHVNPLAFFGYILCLEAFATSGSLLYPKVVKKFGEKAAGFMGVHANEDVGHVESALNFLEKLDPQDHEDIHRNFLLSCQLYLDIYHAIEALAAQENATEKLQKAA